MTALPPSPPSRAGFTLIEVLLAVVIFSIVLAAVNYVFYGALRLRNKTIQASERAFSLQQTLAIMKRDLANMAPAGGTLSGDLRTTGTGGGLLSQADSEFYFSSSAGLLRETSPWPEVQRISYYLAEPTNQVGGSGMELFRLVTRNLLPVQQEEFESQYLMGGVSRLVFLFYDGFEWRETWDSTLETTPMPLAVKVEMELAGDENETEEPEMVSLVVPILVQGSASTNQTSGEEL